MDQANEANTADTVQNTIISQQDAEEEQIKRLRREKREEIKRRIEQKRIEREKKIEEYNKLSTFEKLMADEEESDESELLELSSSSTSEGEDNSEIKTNRLLTANVGTSHKNSNSFRHVKTLNKTLTENDETSSSSDDDEVEDDEKKKKDKKKRQKSFNDAEDDKNSNRMYMDIKSDGLLSSYMSDFFDEGETLTFVQDDDQYKKIIDIEEEDFDNTSKLSNAMELLSTNMKQTAVTILLSKKWTQKAKQDKGKKSKLPIEYQPTFKMKPEINLSLMEQQIVKKVKQTFEVLCSKHTYDVEYTPRFIRIITEMVKNDVKTFKLDRYKIITHVTIMKKLLGQSVFFISKFLCNGNDDYRFCIRSDNKTFIAICLIFLIYRE
jgi:hypothetical protein